MSPNAWLTGIVLVFWLGLGVAVKVSKSTSSLFPIIPLVPGVLWLAGVLVNSFAAPWGTGIIAVVHGGLLLLMLFLLLRWRRRSSQNELPSDET